jgi:oligoribonuclease
MTLPPLPDASTSTVSSTTAGPASSAQAESCVVPSLPLDESNLVWVDLEMTGLDCNQDSVLEIAVVVTDAQVRWRVEGPVIAIHQSEEVLARMDKWNRSTHGKSGLTQRVRESTVDEAAAEATVLEFLRRHVPKGKSPMCGNSICQDRRFLARVMPNLEDWFHYRNLDVSTLKELARRWAPPVLDSFKKAQRHTAIADVHESIDELLHYRQHLLKV